MDALRTAARAAAVRFTHARITTLPFSLVRATALALALPLAACAAATSSTPGELTPIPSPTTPAATTAPQAPPPPSAAPQTPPPAPPHPGVAEPDPARTPGEVFPVAAATICVSGYASRARHVELTQYHDVYAAYGIAYPQPPGTYELDHLIPLELGGDNSDANLWPEPASPPPGFHQKDDLENALHTMVCGGQIALTDAQRQIATDWYATYLRYVAH